MDQLNKHAMSDLFTYSHYDLLVIMIYSLFFQGFFSLEKKQTEAPLLDMFHICFFIQSAGDNFCPNDILGCRHTGCQ